jgi:hypothetical protein
MKETRGLGAIELLACFALLALALAVLLPTVADLGRRGRAAAAARELAVSMHAQRWKAVSSHRAHGLLFERDEERWVWREVADGNGNGLRTAEVRSGTDPTLAGPYQLEQRVSGTRLGFIRGLEVPRIPPRRGTLDESADPVRFGRSDLVSFSPMGSASSGTLFVTDDRDELFGVVLFGPTARVRVWRYDRRVGRWQL